MPHKDYFYQATQSLDAGDIDPALMAKAEALAGGDATKVRSIYVSLKASELERERLSGSVKEAVAGVGSAAKQVAPAVGNVLTTIVKVSILVVVLIGAALIVQAVIDGKENAQSVAAHAKNEGQVDLDRKYSEALAAYEQKFPELNPDHPSYDPAAVTRVTASMAKMEKAGYTKVDALSFAVLEYEQSKK